MKKFKKRAEKFFSKNEKFFYAFFVALGFSLYLLMPGCGASNKNNQVNNPYYSTCLPGQICNGGVYGGAQGGIPLLNAPTFSTLDYMGSQMMLSWSAPQYNAGQGYQGPVNVSGTIRIASASCNGGMYGNYGGYQDYQVQGQGYWVSGGGGYLAQVQQVNLQIIGGGSQYPQYPQYGYPTNTGGTVTIYQGLIGEGQGGYALGYANVAIPMCNRTFITL